MIAKKNIPNVFKLFLLFHLLVWTLVPTISNENLPLDTIEALAWGSNLDWGFNKHPPMSAFFPEVFFQIFGAQDWVYYLLSQIFVIISFYYVFKFSQEFLKSDLLSLISVLLIEALAWGSNLDWGFSKHPPMSAFFPEVFYQIFGSQDWVYYLLSQIFVCLLYTSDAADE